MSCVRGLCADRSPRVCCRVCRCLRRGHPPHGWRGGRCSLPGPIRAWVVRMRSLAGVSSVERARARVQHLLFGRSPDGMRLHFGACKHQRDQLLHLSTLRIALANAFSCRSRLGPSERVPRAHCLPRTHQSCAPGAHVPHQCSKCFGAAICFISSMCRTHLEHALTLFPTSGTSLCRSYEFSARFSAKKPNVNQVFRNRRRWFPDRSFA